MLDHTAKEFGKKIRCGFNLLAILRWGSLSTEDAKLCPFCMLHDKFVSLKDNVNTSRAKPQARYGHPT